MSVGYEFGSFRLDPVRRILTKQGEPVAITSKVFDLLLYLVERHGQVVTKDELLSAVWPDTAIIEANLSQSIFLLRKALGETAKCHQYIVTTPGRGYSFVAKVSKLEENAQPRIRREARSQALRRRLAMSGLATACLLGTAVYLGRTVFGGSGTPAPWIAAPFATFPGGEYEPAFSPDGDRLAFVWNGDKEENVAVYVMAVGEETPHRITSGTARAGSPAWSPDGRSIAFLRYAERLLVSAIYIHSLADGSERRLASFCPVAQIADRHIDWSPKSDELAVADRESAGGPFRIFLISTETGRRTPLTAPPPGSLGDTGPQFSPDGRFIAFRRMTSSAVNELYVVPAATGGEPRRITTDNAFISGHVWSADGKEIVFASKRSGSMGLWRIAVSTGAVKRVPGIGERAYYLAYSRQKHRLAYSEWSVDTNIWRAAIPPRANESGDIVPVVDSTLEDMSPQFSPDARRIVFRSNRSGTDEIWVAGADGRNPVRLTYFRGPLTGTPRWSPDGNTIAFDSRPVGNSDIFVVEATGGPTRRITTDGADDVVPSWSADGKWIYFGSNRTGTWQVWKAPAEGETKGGSIQVTKDGGFAAFESRDRKWLYYAKGLDVPGLWRRPLAGGGEEPVIPELKARYWGYWAIAGGGVYYLDPAPSAACALKFFSFESGKTSTLRTLPKLPPFADSGLALSPDEKSILYPQADHEVSNIMLVENFR